MKYRNCSMLVVVAAMFFLITGCLGEALYVGVKTIDKGVNTFHSKDKPVVEEKEELMGQLMFNKTWVNVDKKGGTVIIRAFDRQRTEYISETEYTLNMGKYSSMSEEEKKVHVRNYFKDRTGIDLDPSLQETVPANELTETRPLKVTPRMPDIPTAGFAPR